MTRALLVALLVLLAPSALAVRATPGHILIYGDSLSDNGVQGDCDWCDRFTDAGFTIWSAAHGGARAYDDFAYCNSGDSYASCEDSVEHQMAYFDGACRVGTANSPVSPPFFGASETSTCLADNVVNGFTVSVVMEGTNSAARTDHANWDSTYYALWSTAYQSMLTSVKSSGAGCLLVVPPPVWEDGGGSNTYPDTNLAIEDIRDYLTGTAATSIQDDMGGSYPTQCGVLNLYDEFLRYEAENGESALLSLYSNCPSKGADRTTYDCVHMSASGNALIGREIWMAVRRQWLRNFR